MMKDHCLLIGTAGHVDHGKTQLIQALTGISTDRLKEERERGISIELGFAHLVLPGGRRAGIVDVPGHERFVRQMLAGASGMDVVLLVIAADEGIMPQTQEHLDILSLLRVENGIVVITKIDIVDQEWLAMIEEDIKGKLAGSFLENAMICKVSSVTGEGIENLILTISKVMDKTKSRRTDLPARMPIDRVFTIQGFGTVVTGTLSSGHIYKGQDVLVEPGGNATRVRNIQVHGEPVTKAFAGQRVAINLSGLAVNDINRGSNLVISGYFQVGQILDVELFNLVSEERSIDQRQRMHFHIGTSEVIGRIHLLNQEKLAPGQTCYAQVILEKPVLAGFGDRFVIRYYSPVTTIGGGTVIGISSIKRKRFKQAVIEEFRIKAQGSIKDIVNNELVNPVEIKEIVKKTGFSQDEIVRELEELQSNSEIITLTEESTPIYWRRESALKWVVLALEEISQYQHKNPLRGGMGREELKNKLGMNTSLKRWQAILEWGAYNNCYRLTGNRIEVLPEIPIPQKMQNVLNCLLAKWEDGGLNPPDSVEVASSCQLSREQFEEYAAYLVVKGYWVHIGAFYFSVNSIEKAKIAIIELLKEKGAVTVSDAREHWHTSRKYAVPLLEHFDSIRLTRREDSIRRLY